MSWSKFVQGSLKGLHSGSDVPDYFGCLIPVLSNSVPTNLIGEQSQTEEDLISIDTISAAPEPEPTESESQVAQVVEEEEEEEVVSDIPREEIQSFDSPIKPPQPPPPVETPESVKYQETDSESEPIARVSDHEEEEEAPRVQRSLADEFRSLGDGVLERYWCEVEGTVPRLRRDSKMMVTFKAAKYEKIRQVIKKAFAPKGDATRAKFSRVKQ